MKNWFRIILVLCVPVSGFAQNQEMDSLRRENGAVFISDSTVIAVSDSLRSLLDKNGKKKFFPVPRTATRLALVPGLGQIYNRDYWKLPIVYLAFGGGMYTYYLNQIKYKDFLTAYESFYDMDKNSSRFGQLLPGITSDSTRIVRVRNLFNTESQYIAARRDAIERQKNYWRRNKNLAIIVAGFIYTLSIIEANVAAHLKTFDLSDDLTLRIEPRVSQPMMRQPAPGVRLVFNFK